jgi:geranylgeranyl diphosphate synthase type II
MIELKTSVLLAASLKMGAILSGASEQDAQYLYEFGKNMGIAFQLQDDYLDTFGTEEKIGKKPGGDIRANKKTFLMLKSRELANEEVLMQMDTVLTQEDDSKVEYVRNLFLELNIDEHSKDIINRYSDKSFDYLDKISLPAERKAYLRSLAEWLLNRQY